jgi:hypothetical protein
MGSQGVWERFKKFKSSNYAKYIPGLAQELPGSQVLDMIKFCKYISAWKVPTRHSKTHRDIQQ